MRPEGRRRSRAARSEFVPAANVCGAGAGGFDYTVSDGRGGTDAGHVTVDLTCVADAPVAVDDSATLAEGDGATAIDVLANDTDVDGGPMAVDTVTQPANGTVVITGGGTGLTYEPDANYCNDPPGTTPDTFTYTLTPGGSRGHGLGDRRLRRRCPDCGGRRRHRRRGLRRDRDRRARERHRRGRRPDVGRLGHPAGERHGRDHRRRQRTHVPAGRELLAGPTRSPTPGNGRVDRDRVRNGHVRRRPARRGRTTRATVAEDSGATAIDVLANDTDPDGGPMSVDSVTRPANGTVVITGGGSGLTYQPDANY